MENALQHALKEAIKNNVPAWYDDEASTQATQRTQHNAPQAQATPAPVATPSPQPSTPKENIMQNEAPRGEKVTILYDLLIMHPDSSCAELEERLRAQGHQWWDSVSGQLKILHDRGLVVRVKRTRASGQIGPRSAYRYWPIADSYPKAMASKKASDKKPKTFAFPINKKKAVKEKATQGLVPVRAYKKQPQEITEEPRQKVMLRVGGFDAKAQVERMSVVEARAVYAELKAIFG
jgi:predicted transcriptional regulator